MANGAVKLTLTHEEIAEIIGRLGRRQPLVLAVQEETARAVEGRDPDHPQPAALKKCSTRKSAGALRKSSARMALICRSETVRLLFGRWNNYLGQR